MEKTQQKAEKKRTFTKKYDNSKCICNGKSGTPDSKISACLLLYMAKEYYPTFLRKNRDSLFPILANPEDYYNGEILIRNIDDTAVLFPVHLSHLKNDDWRSRSIAIYQALENYYNSFDELRNFALQIDKCVKNSGKMITYCMYNSVLGGSIYSENKIRVFEGRYSGYYNDPGEDRGLSTMIDFIGNSVNWDGYLVFQAVFPRLQNNILKYSDIVVNFTANGKIHHRESHCACCCSWKGKLNVCPNDNDIIGIKRGIIRELYEETGLIPFDDKYVEMGNFRWGYLGRYRGYIGRIQNFYFD